MRYFKIPLPKFSLKSHRLFRVQRHVSVVP